PSSCDSTVTIHISGGFMNNIGFSKLFALLFFAGVFALPELGMGQAGSLDPTFGVKGIATTANTVTDAAGLQSDGKIAIAGSIPNSQNFQQGGLLRYTSNGVLDSSFGTGGKVLIAAGNSEAGTAFAVAIQADGKILTAAPASVYSRFSASIRTALWTIPLAPTAV